MNGSTDLNDDAIHWLISAGSSAATSYVTAAKGWAGASHWRYRAVHADGDEEVDQAVGGRKKKRVPGAARKRNDPLDFVALMAQGAAEPEFEMMPRGGARRGRGKPKAKPKAKTLLPEDYHYTAEALARYSLRPRSFLAIPGSGIGPGGGTGAAAGGAFGAQDGGFADFGGDGFGFDGHDDDYDHEGGDAYGGGWDTFGGDGGLERAGDVGDALQLVEAARKVEKVDVNYSRAAKQVDVRSLKELMWGGIQEVLERRKRSGSEREAPIEFGDVLATVPAANAAGRLEDLSVHLCFICVLHLANEHGLVVKGVPELDRLLVSNVPA